MDNGQLGSKIKIPKNMSKSIPQIIYTCPVQKTARKNTKYSINETILKMAIMQKTIAHGKWSVSEKNQNSKKHVKIHSSNHLELFCEKNRSKKHEIFEKSDHFENRPSCKGYSPWKIVSLAKKLKFQNTCQNPFHKSFTLVVCKKLLEKTRNIREMRPF